MLIEQKKRSFWFSFYENLLLLNVRLASNAIPIESTDPYSVNIGLTQSRLKPGQNIFSLVNTTGNMCILSVN